MAKKTVQKLLVMFDTNVLFTKVASDLVRLHVKKIIQENSDHTDLNIEWYLPEVVVGERRYQMLGKAGELLPSLQKLESLLGHKLGIAEDTLELHVNKAIENSVNECGFQIAKADVSGVDWEDLIVRSVNRKPPFEAGDKEKGFRDAVIAHSFIDLHKKSPVTPTVCLLALVTEDKLLQEYVGELTVDSKNIRMLKGLDELENLINTLVATIPEDLAADLSKKAAKLFFEQESDRSLYFKEGVRDKIQERFSEIISNTVFEGRSRKNGSYWIAPPIFIKKEKQRIYWVSPIDIEFEIYHYESDDSDKSSFTEIIKAISEASAVKKGDRLGLKIPPKEASSVSPTAASTSSVGSWWNRSPGERVSDLKGRDKFEVHWSTTLSQAHNLTAAKVDEIRYKGNNLSDDD